MVQLLYRRIALDGAEHGHRRYLSGRRFLRPPYPETNAPGYGKR